MSVQCNSCGSIHEDYAELARHISTSKKGHRRGKKWAASFLLKVKKLNQKKEPFDRIPLSEEDKENRREIRQQVQLSGVKKMVNTLCPHCKKGHSEAIEVEYVNSPTAWKTPRGTLNILCAGCRRD
jgi:hypothetical protein